MKIYTPDGRSAVLKNDYLHVAPDANSENALSIKIAKGLTLKEEGPVPKHTVYELFRSNQGINLSKSGDSTSSLQRVRVSGLKDLPEGGLELFMDADAISAIRAMAPPVSEPDEAESALDLSKPKSQQKESKTEIREPARTSHRQPSRSQGSDGMDFRRAIIFIVAGVLMLNMPQVFMAIFETASGATTGSAVGPDGALTVGAFAKEMEQALESLMTALTLISTLLGTMCFTLGVFKLYKAVSLQ